MQQIETPQEGEEITTEILRAAIWNRVRSTSLRSTARRLGITPTGLQGFLDGARPYHKTLRKYLEWYLSEAEEPFDRVQEIALNVLLIGIPPEGRTRVREGILSFLRTESREPAL